MRKGNSNPFILALTARNLSVEIHHHAAYQLVFSNDAPFTSTLAGQLYPYIHGFLIKPQVPHHCISEEGTLSIFNIEPYSAIGIKLAGHFPSKGESHIFSDPGEMSALLDLAPAGLSTEAVVEALLAQVPDTPYDERVSVITDYIHRNYHESGISPQTFADLVFLSPSRVAALFKQQVGSSLSRYLLWTRLRRAIHRTLSDPAASLTTIAHDCGFYDLPQMNKYMYEMFGMPPKAVKYSSELIQLY